MWIVSPPAGVNEIAQAAAFSASESDAATASMRSSGSLAGEVAGEALGQLLHRVAHAVARAAPPQRSPLAGHGRLGRARAPP